MKLDLNGKVVIVTGGGGAIGSAMCKRFAENGAKVVAAVRTLSKLETVVGEIKAAGGDAAAITVDVADRDSAVELIPGLAAYKAGQADLYAGDGQAEWQNDPSVLARETAQVLAAEEFSGAAFYHLDALLGLPKAEQSSLRETLRAFSADDAPTRTGT